MSSNFHKFESCLGCTGKDLLASGWNASVSGYGGPGKPCIIALKNYSVATSADLHAVFRDFSVKNICKPDFEYWTPIVSRVVRNKKSAFCSRSCYHLTVSANVNSAPLGIPHPI